MDAHHEEQKSDLKVGLVGLSMGIVWIAIVSVIAHFMAL